MNDFEITFKRNGIFICNKVQKEMIDPLNGETVLIDTGGRHRKAVGVGDFETPELFAAHVQNLLSGQYGAMIAQVVSDSVIANTQRDEALKFAEGLDAELTTANIELDHVEKARVHLVERNTGLRSLINRERLSKRETINDLNDSFQNVKREREEIRKELQAANDIINGYADMERGNRELTQQNLDLKSEIDDVEKANEKLVERNNELKSIIDRERLSTRATINDLNNAFQIVKSEREEISDELQAANDTISDLKINASANSNDNSGD